MFLGLCAKKRKKNTTHGIQGSKAPLLERGKRGEALRSEKVFFAIRANIGEKIHCRNEDPFSEVYRKGITNFRKMVGGGRTADCLRFNCFCSRKTHVGGKEGKKGAL